jgi:hypothetical protein
VAFTGDKSKEPGKSNPARLEGDIPKLFWMSYLFVLGAGGVAFVEVFVSVDVPLSLQPVTSAPTTNPNSTIRVYVLFIGAATFY